MKIVKKACLLALAWSASVAFAAEGATPTVNVLPVAGPIGPASADFITRTLQRAEQDGAELVVLEIDTPGGLDDSMRDIVRAILAARVPVAAFVAPSGARAASAGTFILYASPIAAMAPGTNLGAATPVQIGAPDMLPSPDSKSPRPPSGKEAPRDADTGKAPGGDTAMMRKQMHDAAAYIRGLAQMRGRNAEWAEKAVREAVSLSAQEALEQNVIDVVARDVPDLLVKLEGRKVTTAAGARELHASGAAIVRIEPDWRSRFLAVITHPSIALILLMLGAYGLFFEFMNPGFVLPGVVGAICLLLGLFALQLLPVSYAGLSLVLLGLAFMIAEVFLPSFGSLGIGGVIAFAVGALMLIDTDVPGFGVPPALVFGLALVSAAFIFAVAGAALKARRRPVVTGREQLIGSVGIMLDDASADGWARVHGEQWRVQSCAPVRRGQAVRVTSRDGLVLTVVPITDGG